MLRARYEDNDLEGAAGYFTPDVVWHMSAGESHPFSGDFIGVSGLSLFARMTEAQSGGTMKVATRSIQAVGTHLVFCHLELSMQVGGNDDRLDAAWLCRIVDGKIVEVWDVIGDVPDHLIHAAAQAVATIEEDIR